MKTVTNVFSSVLEALQNELARSVPVTAAGLKTVLGLNMILFKRKIYPIQDECNQQVKLI